MKFLTGPFPLPLVLTLSAMPVFTSTGATLAAGAGFFGVDGFLAFEATFFSTDFAAFFAAFFFVAYLS